MEFLSNILAALVPITLPAILFWSWLINHDLVPNGTEGSSEKKKSKKESNKESDEKSKETTES